MTKKLFVCFKWANIVYIILLLLNLFYELFQIQESGTVLTLFGIKITNDITPNQMWTTFQLDFRLLLSYLVTICLFLFLGYTYHKGKVQVIQ